MISPAGPRLPLVQEMKFDGSDPFPTDWSPEQWRSDLNERYLAIRDQAPQLYRAVQSKDPVIWNHFEAVLGKLGAMGTEFDWTASSPNQMFGNSYSNILDIRFFGVHLKLASGDPTYSNISMVDPTQYGFSNVREMWKAMQPFAEALERFISFVETQYDVGCNF